MRVALRFAGRKAGKSTCETLQSFYRVYVIDKLVYPMRLVPEQNVRTTLGLTPRIPTCAGARAASIEASTSRETTVECRNSYFGHLIMIPTKSICWPHYKQ